MFCQKCGNQVVDNAKFCRKCGAKLINDDTTQQAVVEPSSSVTQNPIEPILPKVSVTPVSTVAQKAGTSASRDNELLKTLIGNNSDYYLNQFDKIDRGEKSFNMCALFFAPILLLYRKQFSYFTKLILPVYALLFIQLLLAGYATATFSFELMTVIPYTGLIIAAYAIATTIICGKGFNKQYKEQLNTVITDKQLKITDESIIKKIKPSALIPVLFIILYTILIFVINFAIRTIAVNSLLNSFNTYDVYDEYDSASLSQTYTNDEGQSGTPTMSQSQTSMDVYFIQYTERDNSLDDGFQPTMVLHPDGSFTFRANLYAGLGFVYGTYRLNDNIYTFYVTDRNFRGFIGDDVGEFSMALNGDRLTYLTDEWIGTTHPGQIFYRAESIDFTPYTAFQATHRVATNDGSNLRLRDAPGFNTSQISLLEYGTFVRVLEIGGSAIDSEGNHGNWTYITTQDGRTGWCFGAYLQPLP